MYKNSKCAQDGSCGGRVLLAFVFPHNVKKIDAAEINKLDIEMFHKDSWKTNYFGFKRSRSRDTKIIAGVGLCSLVSAGFFF